MASYQRASQGFDPPPNLTFVLYDRIVSSSMTTDLVTRACERAGLDDFGGDAWREGLSLLIETCESAPGVNPGGREFVYGHFVDALWNRLRVIDYVKRHPEVTDERIERPLVVLGLPRTGTSLASYLLDQDPNRRSLLTWEAEDSVPPSTPDIAAHRSRCLKKKAELDVLAEGLKAAHIPMVHWDEADGPTECVFVQNQDFRAYRWEALYRTAITRSGFCKPTWPVPTRTNGWFSKCCSLAHPVHGPSRCRRTRCTSRHFFRRSLTHASSGHIAIPSRRQRPS